MIFNDIGHNRFVQFAEKLTAPQLSSAMIASEIFAIWGQKMSEDCDWMRLLLQL